MQVTTIEVKNKPLQKARNRYANFVMHKLRQFCQKKDGFEWEPVVRWVDIFYLNGVDVLLFTCTG